MRQRSSLFRTIYCLRCEGFSSLPISLFLFTATSSIIDFYFFLPSFLPFFLPLFLSSFLPFPFLSSFIIYIPPTNYLLLSLNLIFSPHLLISFLLSFILSSVRHSSSFLQFSCFNYISDLPSSLFPTLHSSSSFLLHRLYL